MINGVCNFTNSSLSCRSWLPYCDYSYHCGTEQEYQQYLNDLAVSDVDCSFQESEAPPPSGLCTLINNTCQWYNPCRMWEDTRCLNGFVCGTHSEYWQYEFSRFPALCPSPTPVGELEPPGDCLLQAGECGWSGGYEMLL